MNLREFNLKVLQYKGIADIKAKFPEDLKWITDLDGSKEFNNYLSIMNKVEYDEFIKLIDDKLPFKCYSYELLDKVILLYMDVYISNELPCINKSSLEINLDDYCIINIDKNYNIYRLIKMTDINSCVGYARYRDIVLRDNIRDIDFYEMSEGFSELSNLLITFSENKTIKFIKGDIAKKFWNAGIRKVVDKFNPDFSIPIDNINWRSGITTRDFNDFNLVIEKLKKFDEQFK